MHTLTVQKFMSSTNRGTFLDTIWKVEVFGEVHPPVVSTLSLLMFHQTFSRVSPFLKFAASLASTVWRYAGNEINSWSNSWVRLRRNYHIHCYHDEVWIGHGAPYMWWKCNAMNWWNTICKSPRISSTAVAYSTDSHQYHNTIPHQHRSLNGRRQANVW